MQRRAEQVDQTRRRITEAAVRLHTTVGPARTSIASVAQEAGVTRVTVYRHFADVDALFVACMAHWAAEHPRPDAEAWSRIPDLGERARRAFADLYSWYRENQEDLYPINRDAAAMPLSAQRATEARTRAMADAIVGGDVADETHPAGRVVRAVARHLVTFWTWRSLVFLQDLDDGEGAELAARLLLAVADEQASADQPGPS
jgi:AcrR family transcriptional regulator